MTTCSDCEAAPERVDLAFGVLHGTQNKEQKVNALRVCQEQPRSESIDRKNSSLAATASTGSCVQQDALPYRVEVRLSHSATLCNPLQPSPPLDDNLLHRLAYQDYYCVRIKRPCQRVRRRAPQMRRTLVALRRVSCCRDPSHTSSHVYETPWAGWALYRCTPVEEQSPDVVIGAWEFALPSPRSRPGSARHSSTGRGDK